MTKYIYVLDNYNGAEGVFTSLEALRNFADDTDNEDYEMLSCAVLKYRENDVHYRLMGHLSDFKSGGLMCNENQ